METYCASCWKNASNNILVSEELKRIDYACIKVYCLW